MKLLCVCFSLSLILTSKSWADGDQFRYWSWRPVESQLSLVVPGRQSESPEQAIQKFLRSLEQQSELRELYEGGLPVLTAKDVIQEISRSEASRQIVLIGNRGADTGLRSLRVEKFKKYLTQNQQQVLLWPLGVSARFRHRERDAIHQSLVDYFSMMVLMGGDDVDPRFYKKQNLFSQNTNQARDQLEIDLVKAYMKSNRGFVLGVCRGSQLAAVALGLPLIQDLPFYKGHAVAHQDSWHELKLKPTTQRILESVTLDHPGVFRVNSLHHQAVNFKENPHLEVAATAADGTTEATEFKNGRGLLLQFHPELMGDELGEKILTQAVRVKTKVFVRSCSKVLRF